MDFYLDRNPADPEWLARIAVFHGHLGPWLVTGALVGQDAIQRLNTPGHWKIDVTCWMPSDKHRTPFTCILDGLQASSGATLGKQNIHLACAPDVLAGGWPVVHVVRVKDRDRPAEGVAYRATDDLHSLLQAVRSEKLEEYSRDLAREDVARLFDIRPMNQAELAGSGRS
ncbi:MAG TPA: formylmethanofuran dehydrogenase subunit E family protein [Phycisphaerae bacterium]|nr:formylmethanofuran dehydrogenase subunit E family protein [Phycisphaerae bacterium]HRY67143.1 formylmethanofuran dehydrogenase subunit E family protein [Phycisphaerae bacterium]HSA26488.1 formylmethanofuran dehydrogenase subunit E family protein [Phycisphaerae bacterium]